MPTGQLAIRAQGEPHDDHQQKVEGTTSPRWLGPLRVVCLFVSMLGVAAFLSSIPFVYQLYSTICAKGTTDQCPDGQATTETARMLLSYGIPLSTYALYTVVVASAVALVYLAVAAMIFWRRSDDAMALFVALFLVTFGVTNSGFLQILQTAVPALTLPVGGLVYLGAMCIALVFFLFPSGRFVPRWTRWVAVAYALFNLGALFPNLPMPQALGGPLFLLFVLVMASAQIYRYRRVATPRERVQTKWVVLGFVLMISLIVVMSLPFAFGSVSKNSLYEVVSNSGFSVAALAVPITFGIAITRSQLFDIDVIINRALVYGSLTALLAAVYIGSVIVLQAVTRTLTGVRGDSAPAIVVSTLLIAALFQPLRMRLQRTIDRRFYRSKYDAAKTLARFAATLRSEVELAELEGHLVAVVEETMRPAHVSLWLRANKEGSSFMPRQEVAQ